VLLEGVENGKNANGKHNPISKTERVVHNHGNVLCAAFESNSIFA
jgi:hypothetical protein